MKEGHDRLSIMISDGHMPRPEEYAFDVELGDNVASHMGSTVACLHL